MKKQIADLQAENKAKDEAHKAEMAQLRLDNAVDSALAAAGVKNIKAVKALLDINALKLGDNGKLSGLDEQLNEIAKSDSYLFQDKQKAPHLKGFQPGASGDNFPGGKVDPNTMTYSQMTAFLASNPGAALF